MIITRTPLRIPLGGGGTDVVSYAERFGGFVISAAIDKYVFIAINRRKLDKLIRVSYSKTEIANSVSDVQHPLVREALRQTGIEGGIEIASISDVPSGTGMGTSGSFTVGLLAALHALKRESLSYQAIAEEACNIEINILGGPIGKHDQYLAACGGVTCLDIETSGKVNVQAAAVSAVVLEELERRIMLFYTGISRQAVDILAEQSAKTEDHDPRVISSLHRIKELGKEIKVALEAGILTRFGELIHEHWETKKKLSDSVSASCIDRWYEVARANGAIGGKIIGAGGGGFLMLYCEAGKEKLRAAMKREGLVEMPFRFDFEGSKTLVNF